MAFGGPTPKPAEARVRKHPDTFTPTTILPAPDGVLRGPELPADETWPKATREWWAAWRRSAQARTFQETDWNSLLVAATLHRAIFSGKGTPAAAAELRRRESAMGATREDRLRLRMAIEGTDQGAERPKLAPVVDYRTRLAPKRAG
jgi:hypothetical protein